MKLIVRNILYLFKRFRLSSILNILGLTAAFVVCIVVAIQLDYNLTYNRNFDNAKSIYSFHRYYPENDFNIWTISVPVAEEMMETFPEINSYFLLQVWNSSAFNIHDQTNDPKIYNADLIFGRGDFFRIFTPQILMGDASGVFEDGDKVMISQSVANDMFGDEDPIGKSIYAHPIEQVYTVAAVYKDFPDNCDLRNGIYTRIMTYSDNNWGYRAYFELLPNSYESLKEKLNGAAFRGEEILKQQDLDPSIREDYMLTSLTDKYMIQNPVTKSTTYSLLVILILILVIAYTNFINFSIAIAPVRIKNFNLHKIFGVDKFLLRLSIISEGIFFTLISFIIAVFLVYFFNTTTLSSFFIADLSLDRNMPLLCIVGISFVLLSILISVYPAWYTTSFKESTTLNVSFTLSPKGSKLRNSLITFQYIVAIVLISVSVFIKIQQEYMKNYSIGIQKENIVYLPLKGLKTDYKSFGEKLKSNPNIQGYTASAHLPGHLQMSWNRNFEGKFLQNVYAWSVAPNFLNFFGVDLVAGQTFTKNDTVGKEQVIFNEKFLERYELDENIIGKDFYCFNNGEIVGIASDINFSSLRFSIDPMAFVVLNDQKNWLNYIYLKINNKDVSNTVAYIEDVWTGLNDQDFDLNFLDTTLDNLYENEEMQSKLIGIFALITIVIAIMGTYGMVTFNTRYKVKEIGIRKINGATEKQIVFMLNRSMLTLLFISFIISIPIARLLITKWLDSFAYKASVPWWLFLVSGLLVLLISVFTISWQSWKAAIANPIDAVKSE